MQDAAAAAVEDVADDARDIMSDIADATMDDSPADTPYDDVVIVTTRSRHPSRHGYGGDSDDDDGSGGGGAKGIAVLPLFPIFRQFFHSHENPSSSVISGTFSRENRFPRKRLSQRRLDTGQRV